MISLAIKSERARRSFYEFVKLAWPIVEPAMPFRDGWHIEALCDHLEAVTYGWIRKLLINIPPGHAKSLIVSVLWPAWVWTHNPYWRALFASYAIDLAIRDSVRCRTLIRSDWYQQAYAIPDGWGLSDDQDVKKNFQNTKMGFRGCLSVDGQGTGYRGNVVGIDDPINAKKANSKTERENAIEWFDRTLPTRVNDPRLATFVIIMQRLHEEDLSGHVLAAGGWEHLCLPSEFDPKRRSVTYIRRPLWTPEQIRSHEGEGEIPTREPEEFWRDPREEAGELLFPKLFTRSVLEDLKKPDALGPVGYAAQHDQLPMPAKGAIFQREWWRFWKPDGVAAEGPNRPEGCTNYPARALPKKFDRVIISVDANFKEGERSDYVCIEAWGALGADRFLLDQVRGKWGFPETKRQFRAFCLKWPAARRKYIEEKANGAAIIADLKLEISGLIPVVPKESKEARAQAESSQIESGNVYLPEGAPWVHDYVAEHAAFPKGKNDDQVDTTSQALSQLSPASGTARARAMGTL